MFYLYRFILALILKQGRKRPLDREERERDRREREVNGRGIDRER